MGAGGLAAEDDGGGDLAVRGEVDAGVVVVVVSVEEVGGVVFDEAVPALGGSGLEVSADEGAVGEDAEAVFPIAGSTIKLEGAVESAGGDGDGVGGVGDVFNQAA